jgi:hypothetical protein
MPSVQFDDLTTHIQTDPGTSSMPLIVEVLVFEPEELLEDTGPERHGDSRSGVGHTDGDDTHTIVTRPGRGARPADSDSASARCVLEGVRQQVVERTAEPALIPRDVEKIWCHAGTYSNASGGGLCRGMPHEVDEETRR